MKLLLLLCIVAATRKFVDSIEAPEFNLADGGYTARMPHKPHERKFDTVPPIRALKGPICSYRITNRDPAINEFVPLKFDMIDKEQGTAKLAVIDKLQSFECNKKFEYSVTAIGCNNMESQSIPLTVTIANDENEHVPVFDQQWYEVDVKEGQLYTQILRVSASDADCHAQYGAICDYEIDGSNDPPFAIDNNGVIHNTRALSFKEHPSYVLAIVAKDCGMRRSKPILVTVYVQEACNNQINGIDERYTYYPHTGALTLAPAAELNICDIGGLTECTVDEIIAKVHLATEHIGRGCDREAYLTAAQKSNCGVHDNAVELLPLSTLKEDAKRDMLESNDVRSGLAQSQPSDANEALLFDGETQAIRVATETMNPVLPKVFTLAFWMRHDNHRSGGGHFKENIICSSDDHELNRHHFSVYVRNCKLEMLLRQEADPAIDIKHMRDEDAPAAEWRWSLPEVCDDAWHQYTILYDNGKAQLFVDGVQFVEALNNPEILYDRPLHMIYNPKARLTIGACYHARADSMAQFFKGQLSSMLFIKDNLLSEAAIKCMHQCNEMLQLKELHLQPGQRATFNNELTEVSLSTPTVDSMQALLRQIAYVNSRSEPTPGHRRIDFSAQVRCRNSTSPIEFDMKSIYLFVEKAPPPVLTLSGQATVQATQAQISQGASMFDNLQITVTQLDSDGIQRTTSEKHKLDKCTITPSPAKLDSSNEWYTSPATIGQLGLDFDHAHTGEVTLSGIASVLDYQSVLREVHYFNTAPQTLAERKYSLRCEMLGGKVKSSALEVVMEIINDSTAPMSKSDPAPPIRQTRKDAEAEEKLNTPKAQPMLDAQYHANRMSNLLEMDMPGPKSMLNNAAYTKSSASTGSLAGGAIAVIVVACVGFLLVLLVVGIVRLRTPGARAQGRRYRRANSHGDGHDGLQWDDGELNIIVNPLEDEQGSVMPTGKPVLREEDVSDEETSDSEAEGDGYVEPTEDEDDDVGLPHASPKRVGTGAAPRSLEWDDSPMAPNV